MHDARTASSLGAQQPSTPQLLTDTVLRAQLATTWPHCARPGGGVKKPSALQTFLAATQPFRYVEDRWVQLLISADPVEGCHPAARPCPGIHPRPIIW